MAVPGPYLGNDEVQLILDALLLEDTIEVVWRQKETRDYAASERQGAFFFLALSSMS